MEPVILATTDSAIIAAVGVIVSVVSLMIAYGTLTNSTKQSQFQWLTGELQIVKTDLTICRRSERRRARQIQKLITLLNKAGLAIPEQLFGEDDLDEDEDEE